MVDEEPGIAATAAILRGGGDFPSSDDILDAGVAGLRFFATFLPGYLDACATVGPAGRPRFSVPDDVAGPYDELRGIDFTAFRADAERLADVVGRLDAARHELAQAWAGLDAWQGAAADAADTRTAALLQDADRLVECFRVVPGTVVAAVANIQRQVLDFAGNVHDLVATTCGGQTPAEVAANVRRARGDLRVADVDSGDWLPVTSRVPADQFTRLVLGDVAGPFAAAVPAGLRQAAAAARAQIIDEAEERLRVFRGEFEAKKAAFDRYHDVAVQAVQRDYDTLLGVLEQQVSLAAVSDGAPPAVPGGVTPSAPAPVPERTGPPGATGPTGPAGSAGSTGPASSGQSRTSDPVEQPLTTAPAAAGPPDGGRGAAVLGGMAAQNDAHVQAWSASTADQLGTGAQLGDVGAPQVDGAGDAVLGAMTPGDEPPALEAGVATMDGMPPPGLVSGVEPVAEAHPLGGRPGGGDPWRIVERLLDDVRHVVRDILDDER